MLMLMLMLLKLEVAGTAINGSNCRAMSRLVRRAGPLSLSSIADWDWDWEPLWSTVLAMDVKA
jgi:hypothetical protein